LNKNYLKVVFVDESFYYGNNFPLTWGVITYIKEPSANDILQLIGRSGRAGKAYSSDIYLSSSMLSILLSFINSSDYKDPQHELLEQNIRSVVANREIQRLVFMLKEKLKVLNE
jgi:hypothetical protein